MPDLQAVRRYLAERDVQVVVASRTDVGARWSVRRLEVVGTLSDTLRGAVTRAVEAIARKEPTDYVEGWTPRSGSYQVAPVHASPLIEALAGAYSADYQPDYRPVDDEAPIENEEPEAGFGKVRLLGLVSRSHADRLVIIRAQNPVIEMARDRVTAVIRGGRLSEERRLFAYDRKIDVLAWNDEAIIINPNVFENLVRDPAELRTQLDEAVRAFSDSGLFVGADALEETASGDSNFARGLRRIHRAGYLTGLGVERIHGAIKTWGHNTIRLGPDGRIVFDQASRWDFLHLVDDGYLTSDMTGLRYEVTSKRPWRRVQVTAVERSPEGVVTRVHGPGGWSPRASGEVLLDLDARGGPRYFAAIGDAIVLLEAKALAGGRVLWAGGDERNLLDDLPGA